MKVKESFDYIIIGGGLAGIQLALAFCNDSFFKNKKIAIVEPDSKNKNDKTWCFWEQGKGNWDHLLVHQWENAIFHGPRHSIEMNLGSYTYKMLPAINFYKYAKSELEKHANVVWIPDSVYKIDKQIVRGKNDTYQAKEIFDSRITKGFKKDKNSTTVLQPFKGWVIETKEDTFDSGTFTFMDYRLGHENKSCFTYVLPVSKRKALVEFTFFVPELAESEVYEQKLKTYIQDVLKVNSYSIQEVEEGVIPMSSFAFWRENKNGYHKIGIAGGWVKASTGYSFKNVERKVAELVNSLKTDSAQKTDFWSDRFRFYDEVLLNILSKQNKKGPEVFERMYLKNEAHKIFKFLDEETTFVEELKIMWNTDRPLFMSSVFDLLKR